MFSREGKRLEERKGRYPTPIDLFVGTFFVFFALVLYRDSLECGLNTDAFNLLEKARFGFFEALRWDGSYHYNPVAIVWLWVQNQFFGSHEAAYQVTNVVHHGIMAWFVYFLGLELGLRRTSTFFSGLLLIVAGAVYQNVLWSIVGTAYYLSGYCYIMGLIIFIRALQQRDATRGWLIALFSFFALFSHELSVTFIPACILFFLVSKTSRSIKLLRKLLGGACLTLLFFLAIKFIMSLSSSILGESRPLSWHTYFFVKGFVQSVTLRGDEAFAGPIANCLVYAGPVWLWSALTLVVICLTFYVLRPEERFLLGWQLGHLFTMQVAIGISPRHLLLPITAVVLLYAHRVEVMFSRVKNEQQLSAAHFVTFIVLLTLFAPLSVRDVHTAIERWKVADEAIVSLKEVLKTVQPSKRMPRRLYIANTTLTDEQADFVVYTFHTSVPQLVNMVTPGQYASIHLVHTGAPTNVPPKAKHIAVQTLRDNLERGDSVVLVFDRNSNRFRQVLLAEFTRTRAAMYGLVDPPTVITKQSSPELPWQKGDYPWLNLPPGETMRVDIRAPVEAPAWISIHYVAEPGRLLDVNVNGRDIGTAGPSKTGVARWAHFTREVPWIDGRATYDVILHSKGQAPANFSRVGLFSPQETYNADNANYLHWTSSKELRIFPDMQTRLPLSDKGERIILVSRHSLRKRLCVYVDSSKKQLENTEILEGGYYYCSFEIPSEVQRVETVRIKGIGNEGAWLKELTGVLRP